MEINPNFSLEFINSLPVRKINYGGQILSVRYDDINKRIYLLNKDGKYSGRWGQADLNADPKSAVDELDEDDFSLQLPGTKALDQDEPDGAGTPNSAGTESYVETADSEAVHETDPTDPLIPQKDPKQRFPGYIKVIAVIAAIGLVALLFSLLSLPKRQDNQETSAATAQTTESTTQESTAFSDEAALQNPTAPTDETTLPSTTVEETQPPVEPGVTLLAAAHDLLPGHRISEDDLVLIEVSTLEYQTISALEGIYTAEYVSQLIGLEASQFIATNSYISYDDLTVSYLPANPWGRTEDAQFTAVLPVNATATTLTDYLPGTCADITITTETKVTSTVAPTESSQEAEKPTYEGIEHNSSVVESMIVDTYVLRNVTIIDMLDSAQNSLFPAYSSLGSVPAAYLSDIVSSQYSEIDAVNSVIPVYIKVAAPTDYATLLQSIESANKTVTISNTSVAITTDLQGAVYAKMRDVAAIIADRWEILGNGGV